MFADDSLKISLIGDPRRRDNIHALIAITQGMVAEVKSLLERDLTFVIELLSKHLHLENFEDEVCVAFQPAPIEGGDQERCARCVAPNPISSIGT